MNGKRVECFYYVWQIIYKPEPISQSTIQMTEVNKVYIKFMFYVSSGCRV